MSEQHQGRGRGRPPKPEAEHGRLSIRLSEELLWDVRRAAVEARLGLGDFVKAALAEKMARERVGQSGGD